MTDTPEAHGIPSAAIESFLDAGEAGIDALHGMVLARHGRVVAEGRWRPYRAGLPHALFSVSKSFTWTGVGLAVHEGRLSLDDPVLKFFPDAAPAEVSDRLAAMRVRHLLTMTSGHTGETTELFTQRRDGDWARGFLELPVEHEPSVHFAYNSGASYLLSAIVQRRTGETLLDYLRPRLFDSLGIADPTWETCPRGISASGWGLALRTGELARFGQLYLNGGVFQGRQLVPAEWVREATAWQVSNGRPDAPSDWSQGYGYQFWRCRHDAYRGDGAFGQFCLVLPEQEAVLAMTGGLWDMQVVLDLVWEHLLPALAPGPLPADDAAARRLAERLATLELPPERSRTTPEVSLGAFAVPEPAPQEAPSLRPPGPGWLEQPAITGLALAPRAGGWLLTLREGDLVHHIDCGDGAWLPGEYRSRPVATSAGWADGRTLVVRMCFPQSPFVAAVTCRFDDAGLTAEPRLNVDFGSTEFPAVRLHPAPVP
ncbi:serine hydrolase domain-containing protein [Rhizomonospora bruguierae]|uniref:serine hydrolase domain-containing protein n=1 Tax=Rhizomonospora bruguierae TaxID=1581705 RepID=UPI001BCDAD5E|nr:serine hydrolase [Micromonospora sp. NBRC 107566]